MWQYVVARTLGIAGGVFTVMGVTRLSTAIFAMGAASILLASVLNIWRVLAYLPKGTSLHTRVDALWRNPWVLSSERAYIALPTVILTVFIYGTGQGMPLRLLAILAVIAGFLTVYLGSPHEFVNRALARIAPAVAGAQRVNGGPFRPSDLWKSTDLRSPPEGFPEIPTGRIIGVVQNARTKSYAVLINGVGQRPAEWNRWSHTDSEWETPIGRATAEAHEIWDGRPEAIITITLPSMMIVIEGAAGKETALANARLLTRCLVSPEEQKAEDAASQASAATKPLFERTIGYPYLYSFLSVVVGAILVAVLVTRDIQMALSQGPVVRLAFVGAFGVPAVLLLLNLVGIIRPQAFRLDRKQLRSRSQRAFWMMLFPTLLCGLFTWVIFERTQWAPVTGWGPPALCLAVFITMFLIRSPEKAARRERMEQ